MKSIDQYTYLTALETKLEGQLQEVSSVFQNLPEELLLKQAENGGWSIAECFEHLNSYAAFYLPEMEKAIAKATDSKDRPHFKHGILGKYFIDMMDTSKSKNKYKAMKKHKPQSNSDAHVIISAFIQNLEIILRLLKQSVTKNLMKIYVKTSISPLVKLNVGDALLFLLTHNQRHLEQARRNLI